MVGLRRVSIGGKVSRTVEEPGEAGSFDGNGRRNQLLPFSGEGGTPLIESPMKLREVNEFLEKEGASLYIKCKKVNYSMNR